jgi:hypothetical protein
MSQASTRTHVDLIEFARGELAKQVSGEIAVRGFDGAAREIEFELTKPDGATRSIWARLEFGISLVKQDKDGKSRLVQYGGVAIGDLV